MRKSNTVALYTAEGESLSGTPWDCYPRPQLQRSSFYCLNGTWDFAVSNEETIPTVYPQTIRVPFTPESLLSGIHRTIDRHCYVFYRRTFALPDNFVRERVLLHFGAVDQIATIFINGCEVGHHVGGYEPFCVDITDVLETENTVVVRVKDELDTHILPYGKQCRKRGGMWYTPVTGIWQTVWVESVPHDYIRSLRIDTSPESVQITVDGVSTGTVVIDTPHGKITAPLFRGICRVALPKPRQWSPEDPYLYTFTVTADEDTISSYFAMRTLSVQTVNGVKRLCLNGKPYFFHALLDQGYFSDGLFLPATPKGYEQDILLAKSCGFNTLRKHIKVEPERFYYDCDRLGMVVFQDMINNGHYSFFRDTALPTIGWKRRNDKRMHRHLLTRQAFLDGMKQTVQHLHNHPCVCYWTIFNEGWGQFDSAAVYQTVSEMDRTRFIDTASGWFVGAPSQVESLHVYFKPVVLPVSEKPIVLSEFGGYSYKPEKHVFNVDKTYGYRFFKDRSVFQEALERLYETEIIPAVKRGLCAAVYTQLSDVEDETNGLISYDRKVLKVDTQKMLSIAERLQEELL